MPAFLASRPPDVALVRVTPPDRHGWCSVGPSVSYIHAALDHATVRIAEVDPALPRTCGQSMVHVDQLDVLVEATEPLPVYDAATPNPVSDAIAGHIMPLLPDWPLLQLGIGAVPEALVAGLADKGIGDLRFTGMGSDGMVGLAERGLLDRRHHDGIPPISAPDLLGTSRLMEWADDNPSIGVYPSTFAQHPLVLAGRDRLVSINSAVEVDLAGQVNAERVRRGHQDLGNRRQHRLRGRGDVLDRRRPDHRAAVDDVRRLDLADRPAARRDVRGDGSCGHGRRRRHRARRRPARGHHTANGPRRWSSTRLHNTGTC